MKRIKLFPLFLLFLFFMQQTGYGQMSGNPVGVRGRGEWTMSAIGTLLNQPVGNEWMTSQRLLLKTGYGVAPRLDLYVLTGGARVQLESNKPGISDLESSDQFAYGAGFNLMLKQMTKHKMGIWAGAQVLRFPVAGSFSQNMVSDAESLSREFCMDYDWREFQGQLGVIFPVGNLRIYLAGAGWTVQRKENKKEFLISGESRSLLAEAEADFQASVWTGGVIGFEVLLPHRYSITLEGLFFNEEYYQIMVGVCQTGLSTF